MVKDDFINEKVEKARKAAEAQWDRMMETRSATIEGIEFYKWMKKVVAVYAQEASEKLRERYRYSLSYDERSIYNVVYSFILHLVRRNCDIGSQIKSISPKDVEKGRAIVRHIIDLASAESWRQE